MSNDWRPFAKQSWSTESWSTALHREHRHLIVIAFAHDDPAQVEIFRCRVAEYGALFPENTTFLTILEQGWVPYAWRLDDSPTRNDEKFPPMWSDYLKDHTPGKEL